MEGTLGHLHVCQFLLSSAWSLSHHVTRPSYLAEKNQQLERERETDAWAALSLCSQPSRGTPYVDEAIWGVPALVSSQQEGPTEEAQPTTWSENEPFCQALPTLQEAERLDSGCSEPLSFGPACDVVRNHRNISHPVKTSESLVKGSKKR